MYVYVLYFEQDISMTLSSVEGAGLLPEHVHLVPIAWPVLEPEPLVRQSVPDPATLL